MIEAGVRATNHALAPIGSRHEPANPRLTSGFPGVLAGVSSAPDQSAILGVHVADAK
jgi:hypothetical protein